MSKVFSILILSSIVLGAVSCITTASNQDRTVANQTLLKKASCDQLIPRAQDKNDVLNHLAALYAKQKCSGYVFNYNDLTEKEIKVFSGKFDINSEYGPKIKPKKPVDPNVAIWRSAWSLYRKGQTSAAIAALTDISKNPDVNEKSRALFFLGKLSQKMNRSNEAKQYFESAAAADIFSFHALAAHYELKRPLPPLTTVFKSPTGAFPFDSNLSFLSQYDFTFFKSLLENEEYEMLNRTCNALAKNDVECTNLGLYLAEHANYYNVLYVMLSKIDYVYKKDIFIQKSRLFYPELNMDIVNEMSRKTNTPVSLILAITKQESSFYPYSLSRANAYGLMQLLPELAKNLARAYNVPGLNKPEDLFDPQINIPLGTYELANQIKQQKGQLTYVGIAYNAGPGNLRKWLGLSRSSDMFEFIEDIPFEETRNYVKVGARNMLFYQRMAQPTKEIYFPKEFIEVSK